MQFHIRKLTVALCLVFGIGSLSGTAMANPAVADAGCSFPNGTLVFYFRNLFSTPAINSKFLIQVWTPNMSVNCNGGSSLANTQGFLISVTQVTNYNDIGGGHYIVIAGRPTSPDPKPSSTPTSHPSSGPSSVSPPPVSRGSRERSGGATVPSSPPTIPKSVYDPSTQRATPNEVADKLSGVWSYCNGAYNIGEAIDVTACVDQKAPKVCDDLISKRYFDNYRDCRGEMDRIPHRIGRSRG